MQKFLIRKLYNFVNRIRKNSESATTELRQHLYFLDYEERDSDIYIVTFPKSGTTWLQVILYNLLFEVDLNFKHIYDVSPWIRNEAFLGKKPERVNKLPSPRIIKTHDKYDFFSDKIKGKFIFLYREGKDVAVSFFHHNKNYKDPNLTFDKNFEASFMPNGRGANWFTFTNKWLKNSNNLDILYISYESLKLNFKPTVKKIASFLNVDIDDEKITKIQHNTSFENMKINEIKFGEIPPKSSQFVFNEFIRKGDVGDGKTYLSKEQTLVFDIQYQKFLKPFEKLFHI